MRVAYRITSLYKDRTGRKPFTLAVFDSDAMTVTSSNPNYQRSLDTSYSDGLKLAGNMPERAAGIALHSFQGNHSIDRVELDGVDDSGAD